MEPVRDKLQRANRVRIGETIDADLEEKKNINPKPTGGRLISDFDVQARPDPAGQDWPGQR